MAWFFLSFSRDFVSHWDCPILQIFFTRDKRKTLLELIGSREAKWKKEKEKEKEETNQQEQEERR